MLYSHPRETMKVPVTSLTVWYCKVLPGGNACEGHQEGPPMCGSQAELHCCYKCFHSDSRAAATIFTLYTTYQVQLILASIAANTQPSEGLLLYP